MMEIGSLHPANPDIPSVEVLSRVPVADRGTPVVDDPAWRHGHVQRLGLDPADEPRVRARAPRPLAVHPTAMEIDVIQRLGPLSAGDG
jgi:hypothetical protein